MKEKPFVLIIARPLRQFVLAVVSDDDEDEGGEGHPTGDQDEGAPEEAAPAPPQSEGAEGAGDAKASVSDDDEMKEYVTCPVTWAAYF